MTEAGKSEKIEAIKAFSRVCAVRICTSSPEAACKSRCLSSTRMLPDVCHASNVSDHLSLK